MTSPRPTNNPSPSIGEGGPRTTLPTFALVDSRLGQTWAWTGEVGETREVLCTLDWGKRVIQVLNWGDVQPPPKSQDSDDIPY